MSDYERKLRKELGLAENRVGARAEPPPIRLLNRAAAPPVGSKNGERRVLELRHRGPKL